MNEQDQRIAIAQACGWKNVRMGMNGVTLLGGLQGRRKPVPNYPRDLNAMHDAEKTLTDDQWDCDGGYLDQLEIVTGTRHMKPGSTRTHAATAAQRAEAFLRALNLWKP